MSSVDSNTESHRLPSMDGVSRRPLPEGNADEQSASHGQHQMTMFLRQSRDLQQQPGTSGNQGSRVHTAGLGGKFVEDRMKRFSQQPSDKDQQRKKSNDLNKKDGKQEGEVRRSFQGSGKQFSMVRFSYKESRVDFLSKPSEEEVLSSISVVHWLHLKKSKHFEDLEAELKKLNFKIVDSLSSVGTIKLEYNGRCLKAGDSLVLQNETQKMFRSKASALAQFELIIGGDIFNMVYDILNQDEIFKNGTATVWKEADGKLIIIADKQDIDTVKDSADSLLAKLVDNTESSRPGECSLHSSTYEESLQKGLSKNETGDDTFSFVDLIETISVTENVLKLMREKRDVIHYIGKKLKEKNVACEIDTASDTLLVSSKDSIDFSLAETLISHIIQESTIDIQHSSALQFCSVTEIGEIVLGCQSQYKERLLVLPDEDTKILTLVGIEDEVNKFSKNLIGDLQRICEVDLRIPKNTLQFLMHDKWGDLQKIQSQEGYVIIVPFGNGENSGLTFKGTTPQVFDVKRNVEMSLKDIGIKNSSEKMYTEVSDVTDKHIELLEKCCEALAYVRRSVENSDVRFMLDLEHRKAYLLSGANVDLSNTLKWFSENLLTQTFEMKNEPILKTLSVLEVKERFIKEMAFHSKKMLVEADEKAKSLTITFTVNMFPFVTEQMRKIQKYSPDGAYAESSPGPCPDIKNKMEKDVLKIDKTHVGATYETGDYSVACKLSSVARPLQNPEGQKKSLICGKETDGDNTRKIRLKKLEQNLYETSKNVMDYVDQKVQETGVRLKFNFEVGEVILIAPTVVELDKAEEVLGQSVVFKQFDMKKEPVIQLFQPTEIARMLADDVPAHGGKMLACGDNKTGMLSYVGTDDIIFLVNSQLETISKDFSEDFVTVPHDELTVIKEKKETDLREIEQQIQHGRIKITIIAKTENKGLHIMGTKAEVVEAKKAVNKLMQQIKEASFSNRDSLDIKKSEFVFSGLSLQLFRKSVQVQEFVKKKLDDAGFSNRLTPELGMVVLHTMKQAMLEKAKSILKNSLVEKHRSLRSDLVCFFLPMSEVAQILQQDIQDKREYILIQPDEETHSLTLVATVDVIPLLSKALENILGYYVQTLEHLTKEQFDYIKLHEEEFVKKLETLSKERVKVELRSDGTKHEMLIMGTKDCVPCAKDCLAALLDEVEKNKPPEKHSTDYSLSERVSCLLSNKKEVYNYVDEKLDDTDVVWNFDEVNQKIVFTSLTQKGAEEAEEIVRKSVEKHEINMAGDPVLSNLTLQDICEMLMVQEALHHNKLMVYRDDSTKCLTLVGTDDILPAILLKLEEIRKNCSDVDEILEVDAEYMEYILKFKRDKINQIQSNSDKQRVKITENSDGKNAFCFTGTRGGVQRAKQCVEKLVRQITMTTIPMHSQDQQHFLSSREGRQLCLEMEPKHQCLITWKGSSELFSAETSKIAGWTSKSGAQVIIVKDQLANMKVDVLCVPVLDGQQYHPYTVPDFIKGAQIQEKSFGCCMQEIAKGKEFVQLSQSPSLSVAYTLLPVEWKNGQDKEKEKTRKAIKELLTKVEDKQFSSVAIPVQFSDKFPLKKVYKSVLQALKEFFSTKKGVTLSLKTVSLVIKSDDIFREVDMIPITEKGLMGWTFTDYQWKPHSRIKLELGNLAKQRADVLVNSTNCNLQLTEGMIAKSLLKAAGPELQKECKKKYSAGIQYGQVAVTEAHNLKLCRSIFHGSLPGYLQTEETERVKIMDTFIQKCLHKASESEYRTIAFPTLGVGNLGYPKDVVVKAMFNSVEHFFKNYPESTLRVLFVLFPEDKALIKKFQAEQMLRNYGIGSPCVQSQGSHYLLRKEEFLVGKTILQVINSDISKCEGHSRGMLCLWQKDEIQDPSCHPLMKNVNLDKIHWKTEIHKNKTGSVFVTGSDCLPAAMLIHTLFMNATVWDIKEAVRLGLEKAVSQNLDTLQIPVRLGGILSSNPEIAAKIILNCLKDKYISDGLLNVVTVVITGKHIFDRFASYIKKHFNEEKGFLSDMSDYFWSSPLEGKTEETETESNSVLLICDSEANLKNAKEDIIQEIKKIVNKTSEESHSSSVDPEERTDSTGQTNTENRRMQTFPTDIQVLKNCKVEVNPEVLHLPYFAEKLDLHVSHMSGIDIIREGERVFLKGTAFIDMHSVYQWIQNFVTKETDKKPSSLEQEMHGGAKPKYQTQTSEPQDVTVDKVQYDAIIHIIGQELLEKTCFTEQQSGDQIKVCFIGEIEPNSQIVKVQQRIMGLRRSEFQILSEEEKERAASVQTAVHKEFQKVFCKYLPEKKSVVIIGEEWNEITNAERKAKFYLGQLKATSRSNRKFTKSGISGMEGSLGDEYGTSSVYDHGSGSNSLKFWKINVSVRKADITKLKVDAIVNAANGDLMHGGGVARAIATAAGPVLVTEGNKHVHDNGPIPVTGVALTTAGNLPCKMVLHAVGPRWYDYTDKNLCLEDLCRTILKCLCVASRKGLESIAIPSISSAIFAVPTEQCAKMYIRAVKHFTKGFPNSSLNFVQFVDVRDEMIDLIQKELNSQWNKPVDEHEYTYKQDQVFINDCLNLQPDQETQNRSTASTKEKGSDGQGGQSSAVRDGASPLAYVLSLNTSIMVLCGDIVKTDADAIVTWEEPFTFGFSSVAKALKAKGKDAFLREFNETTPITRTFYNRDIVTMKGEGLRQSHVICSVLYHYSWSNDLESVLTKILTVAQTLKIKTIAVPTFVHCKPSARNKQGPVAIFAEELCKALLTFSEKNPTYKLHVNIVDLKEETVYSIRKQVEQFVSQKGLDYLQKSYARESSQPDKRNSPGTCTICLDAFDVPRTLSCGHTFCESCIDQHFRVNNPVCPVCNAVHGVMVGNMPHGTMSYSIENYLHLPGCSGNGTIIIDYRFQDGYQMEGHPNPGKPYKGTTRTAYLPDNDEGNKVLKLLQVAWNRRLTFTIGRSVTTGKENVVTWNDIHHKTNVSGGSVKFGYPDSGYLKRVQEELAAKGVTERDLPTYPVL